jgi:hypothetical protein
VLFSLVLPFLLSGPRPSPTGESALVGAKPTDSHKRRTAHDPKQATMADEKVKTGRTTEEGGAAGAEMVGLPVGLSVWPVLSRFLSLPCILVWQNIKYDKLQQVEEAVKKRSVEGSYSRLSVAHPVPPSWNWSSARSGGLEFISGWSCSCSVNLQLICVLLLCSHCFQPLSLPCCSCAVVQLGGERVKEHAASDCRICAELEPIFIALGEGSVAAD